MNGFTPGLLDRLMDERRDVAPGTPVSMEGFKDSVARDLEALLNTRIAIDPFHLAGYPHARASLLHYGLVDFAGFCLTSSSDRDAVCASIEAAIAAHEPRLSEVRAVLEAGAGDVNRLQFAIHARLALGGQRETINFNAVLQPSSLHYDINRSVRPAKSRDTT
ncbi:type VI secretion system baseplate subunit TssE [Massilia aurea]|uniref:type VI secretion system baseplate subunit TssE n=1 Tax=Massilia aurea TaxID=373040 RepID=UPI003462BBDB